MKAVRIFLTSAAAAGLAASAGAQPPVSAMAPPPPVPTGIAPQPPQPGTPTIWEKLGVSKQQREYCRRGVCKTPFGAAMNTIVSPFSKLSCGLIPPFCPTTPSLAELQDPGPVGAAAKVKQDRAGAEERIKAVRYLATVDCHYWPEAEEALINALRNDRNEAVRFEAAVAFATGCCCTPKVVVALSNTVGCSTSDGGFMEKSAEVRHAAEVALEKCMPCCACGDLPSLDIEGGKKGTGEKGKGEKPPEDKNSRLPTDDGPNAELKAYYAKAGKLPKAVVLNYAMKAMEISRQYGVWMTTPSNPMDLVAAGVPVPSAALGRPRNLWDMLVGHDQPAATIAYTSRAVTPQNNSRVASANSSPTSFTSTIPQSTEPPVTKIAATKPAPTPAPVKIAPKVEVPAQPFVMSMMDTPGSVPMPAAPKSTTPTPTMPMVTSMADTQPYVTPRPVAKVDTPSTATSKVVSMADTSAPVQPRAASRSDVVAPMQTKVTSMANTSPTVQPKAASKSDVVVPVPTRVTSMADTSPPVQLRAASKSDVVVPVPTKVTSMADTPVISAPKVAPKVEVPAKLPASVPNAPVVSVMSDSKPMEKKPSATPVKVVDPVPVQPAGIARVVSKPLPTSETLTPVTAQPAPTIVPAASQTTGMMAEPISLRPAIPARQ